MLTRALLPFLLLALGACEPASSPRIGGEQAASGRVVWSSGRAEGFHLVECRLPPGPSIRLRGGTLLSAPRRIVRTTADDCADRFGQYIVYEPENFPMVLDVRLPRARDGDAESQMYVGDIYARGVDGRRDPIEAINWYERSARQNYEPAKVRLAFITEEQRTGAAAASRLERTLERRSTEIEAKERELAGREAELDALRERLRAERSEAESDRAEREALRALVDRLKDDLDSTRNEFEELRRSREAPAEAIVKTLLEEVGPFDFGTYRALVIGNGAYPNYRDGGLKSAVDDAEVVADVLETTYGYKVIRRFDVTRSEILRAFRILHEDLGPDDNLLVYYAGHGEFRNDQGYWLGNNYGVDPDDAIPTDEITGILRDMEAKHVMVIADSCYAGALAGDAMRFPEEITHRPDPAWVKTSANRSIRLAMTSGGLNPVLDGDEGGKHSIFAQALIKELGGNDDIMRGAKLFLSIAAHVQNAAKKNFDFRQEPTYSPLKGGEDIGWDYFFVPGAAAGVDES